MINTIIFISVIIIVLFFVKKLTKNNVVYNENGEHKKYIRNVQIKEGNQFINTPSINSSELQPIPKQKYFNHETYWFKEFKNNQISTKNMFVESHHELNLSIFERELTEQKVIDAYLKLLNKNIDHIAKGIPDAYNITDKKEAKDYLLAYLNKNRKKSEDI